MPATQQYTVCSYAVNNHEVTTGSEGGYPEEPFVRCRLYLYIVPELENLIEDNFNTLYIL